MGSRAAHLDIHERRRRLGVRHALAPSARASGPLEAADRMVALHGTDPATVFLSARARVDGLVPGDVEEELYETRRLIRMLGMRRTVFVVPTALREVIQDSTMHRVAAQSRRVLLKHLSELGGINDPGPWLDDVESGVLAALSARGGAATAAELVQDEPRLATGLMMAAGKAYGGRTNITSRVLVILGARGLIVRGRPSGSWLSQRYEWVLTSQWLEDSGVGAPSEGGGALSPDDASCRLAARWLRAFGPAPIADLRWWTGWTAAQAKRALACVGAVEADLGDAGTGAVLPDDLDLTPDPGPWAALLPTLDPTPMGWAARDWYLGPHKAALFDTMGNIGPSIWVDGRIAGGWAQRLDGEIALDVVEDVGADARALVEREAAALAAFLGDRRITPRFRTPTERRLSA